MDPFRVFGILFPLMFLLVAGVFIVAFIKIIGTWHKNNNSPRLTVPATVVAKRTNHSHHHTSNSHVGHHHTHYYVTFEVESGDRMELSVIGSEFGLLVEGDKGRLTFQGTRYLGFERQS
ncbi:MAG: DUF2500 domain-containing protein [Clostridia bacterium]|nr:DUF2500 domain-containing protein [Clostridia bacterium]